MEATERYEFDLAQTAYEVCIVKPLVVRRYAGAISQLPKTDKINAALTAEFGRRCIIASECLFDAFNHRYE